MQAILATVFGAFIGALVGLDLQTRFHLGIGAWSVSGVVGAVVGFLAFKPTEMVTALKKAWNDMTSWRWHLHGHSAEYRKLWKLRAMWFGLDIFGIVLTISLLVWVSTLRNLPTINEVNYALLIIGSISLTMGIEFFLLLLFGGSLPDEPLEDLVSQNRRRFFCYFNPVAVCVWVLIGIGLGVREILRVLPKTPPAVFRVLRWLAKLLAMTIKYSATHERFTVSASAGTGAISGFFLGQGNTIFGLLGGAVFGVLFLFVSKLLSGRVDRMARN